jgi:hypothetical protein
MRAIATGVARIRPRPKRVAITGLPLQPLRWLGPLVEDLDVAHPGLATASVAAGRGLPAGPEQGRSGDHLLVSALTPAQDRILLSDLEAAAEWSPRQAKAVADAMERMAQVGWCLAGLPGRPLLARPTGGSMEFALGEMFGAKQRDFARQRLSIRTPASSAPGKICVA